jgi:hypothetical protein
MCASRKNEAWMERLMPPSSTFGVG